MTFIQRHINVDATSWRCIDVDMTLFQRCVSDGFDQLSYLSLSFTSTVLIQRTTNWHFLYFFPKNRLWHFIQIISMKMGFDISCKLSPELTTICMICQSLFSEKKNISKCRLQKLFPRMQSVKFDHVHFTAWRCAGWWQAMLTLGSLIWLCTVRSSMPVRMFRVKLSLAWPIRNLIVHE